MVSCVFCPVRGIIIVIGRDVDLRLKETGDTAQEHGREHANAMNGDSHDQVP